MSINKLVSIKNAIVDAQDALGVDHDKDIPWFTRLAIKAEKDIGSRAQYERARVVLEVNNNICNLPNDAVLIEVGLIGAVDINNNALFSGACGYGAANFTAISGTAAFLVVDYNSDLNGYNYFGYNNYNIQNNKMIFTGNNCASHMTIQYLRYVTDCDGFVKISENHVDAITEYIKYNYLQRKKNGNYIDRDNMRMAFQEWNRKCAHARAEDGRSTETETRQMVALYHNPWSGIGMWQGMYTTLGTNYNIW